MEADIAKRVEQIIQAYSKNPHRAAGRKAF
jgi:hypothetical protein